MDVILTISFKITAEIEITEHMFSSYFAGEVYRLFVKHNCSFILSLPWNAFTLVFFSVNAAHLSTAFAGGSSMEKALN